ncbi:MAG: ATP-binding protein [Bacteroidetes bacterium]|nr:ATP-binding protein [Bacteroidota bacterium]
MIRRALEHTIRSRLHSGKAILLMGPRQVGKTTLLKKLFPLQEEVLWLEGDEKDVQDLFENASASRLKAFFGKKKTVIIDEAQRIKEIGLRMKLITDQIKEVQLIATGSSAFELANRLNEPLTGRKWEYKMYPVSFEEMVTHHGFLEEKRLLPHRLVFGYYPEVVTNPGKERDILKQLSDSYLYKDVLLLEQIKKPEAIVKLLQALAYQIGSQVSYNELSNLTGLDAKTVEKYIYVLEQTYVVFRLGSFSRNLRSELKKSRKIYFYDNGIRNALIANFNPIESRMDAGALWENFLMSERKKYLEYHRQWVNAWYWRTKEQNEIDYIEEAGGMLHAYEFKWNPKAKVRLPKTFLLTYPNSQFTIIHPQNVEEFLRFPLL